jgi:hypothetical protein
MAVTHTTPIQRPDVAVTRVAHVILTPGQPNRDPRVEVKLELLDSSGNIIGVDKIIAGPQDDAEYTLAQYLTIAPTGTSTHHTDLEQALVTAGRIPGGTIT